MSPLARSRTPYHATPVLVAALLSLATATSSAAQSPAGTSAPPADQTLTSDALLSVYGGPEVRITRLANHTVALVGGRAGMVVNHTLLLGVAGYANANRHVRTGFALPSGRAAGLDFGYGGVDLGWVGQPSQLVHVSLGALVGAGAMAYSDPARHNDEDADPVGPTDAFFVAEPSAALELNVARNLRVAVGGSYRLVSGARLPQVRSADLNGPVGSLTLRFGQF